MKREMVNGIERVTVAYDHPYHRLLSARPNSWQTATEFVRTIVGHAALGKGALCILVRDGAGTIKEILPVPMGAWVQEQLADSTVQYRVSYANGHQQVFPQKDTLFVRGPVSVDGYSGIGVSQVAHQAMTIIVGLEKQQLALSANNGRPSGVVSLDAEQDLDNDKMANLKASWDATYGPTGKGGVAVLPVSVKYSSMAMSFADAQFMENRDFQIREVARFFRVDPSYLFVAGTKTYASADMTRREHWSNCLMPHVVAIEQALNRALLDDDPRYFFDFDEADLLRGNALEQANYLTKLLGAGGSPGIISVNEARRELGRNELEGEQFTTPPIGGYAASKQEEDNPKTEKEEV